MIVSENQIVNLPTTLEKFRTLIQKTPSATNPKGRIGQVYRNFASKNLERCRYTQFKWYGQMVYAPSISEEILKAGYGTDCLPDHDDSKEEEIN